jgi:ribosomal protein S18 acetylase RimI-like enzyme
MRAETARAASRTESVDCGTLFSTPELPAVWDLNFAWLDSVPAQLPAVPKVVFGDPRGAEALGGWDVRRIAVLAWRGGTPSRGAGVEQVGPDEQAPVQLAITLEDGVDEETAAQLEAANRLREARTGKRSLGRIVDGRVVALADLYSDGEVGQIEDVATLPEHRRRGYGREVVLAAVAEAAGLDLIFITAVATGAAVSWYESMGFAPLGSYFEATPGR